MAANTLAPDIGEPFSFLAEFGDNRSLSSHGKMPEHFSPRGHAIVRGKDCYLSQATIQSVLT